MSADHWAECPRCKGIEEAKWQARQKAKEDGYGKVPLAEFKKLEAAAAKPPASNEDFREDFSIGISGVGFHVIYKGECQKCRLAMEFNHSKDLKLK